MQIVSSFSFSINAVALIWRYSSVRHYCAASLQSSAHSMRFQLSGVQRMLSDIKKAGDGNRTHTTSNKRASYCNKTGYKNNKFMNKFVVKFIFYK